MHRGNADMDDTHLREQGVLIRHDETCSEVELLDDGVVMRLESGKKMRADLLLWANGRSGNSTNLGMQSIGLATDSRGNLSVNENYQTTKPNIYAVGDIIGPPWLAQPCLPQRSSQPPGAGRSLAVPSSR